MAIDKWNDDLLPANRSGSGVQDLKRKGQRNMSRSSISRDAAVAAATVILEEFFWVYPDEQMESVGCRLVDIIKAATDAALEFQRRALSRTTDN
jgi:hypothetical protein